MQLFNCLQLNIYQARQTNDQTDYIVDEVGTASKKCLNPKEIAKESRQGATTTREYYFQH